MDCSSDNESSNEGDTGRDITESDDADSESATLSQRDPFLREGVQRSRMKAKMLRSHQQGAEIMSSDVSTDLSPGTFNETTTSTTNSICSPRRLNVPRRGSRVTPESEVTASRLFEETEEPRREFVLQNKAPFWNELSQVYQLDFGGRVTQESAKNFQIEHQGNQVCLACFHPFCCLYLFFFIVKNLF